MNIKRLAPTTKAILTLMASLGSLIACAPNPDGQYATTVHPILSQRCSTCHSREST